MQHPLFAGASMVIAFSLAESMNWVVAAVVDINYIIFFFLPLAKPVKPAYD
jgi:hypothetical protein